MQTMFQKVVERSKELRYPESHLLITAFLSEKLGGLSIVGGFAASLYTLGDYRTRDVDVVQVGTRGTKIIEEQLKLLGFKRNRVWWHEEADYALDIVAPPEPERTQTFEIYDYKVKVESPEQVIVTDLAGYKFWNDGSLLDRAVLVFKAQKNNLDIKYLKMLAHKRGVTDALENLTRSASR